jgi:hypothetical protein
MSNKCFTSLERENAQMRAVIEQQKETIETQAGLLREGRYVELFNEMQAQATLIEILRDTLKCIVPCYIQGRFTGEIEMHRVYEALQQYEQFKGSR